MSDAEVESLKKQLEVLARQNAELRVQVETWKLKYEQLTKTKSPKKTLETLKKKESLLPKSRISHSTEPPKKVDLKNIDVAEAIIYGIKKDLLPRSVLDD